MANIKITDTKLTAEDMTLVKGGAVCKGKTFPKVEMNLTGTTQRVGLLLPAVQKIS